MEYPKLKTRPMSTQVCTNFCGLDRRPGASARVRNKTWQWYWHDERNLSADRYPRLSVRKNAQAVASIDGNNPVDDIVAMCGGDHPVLLDRAGYIWCNGHSLLLSAGEQSDVGWVIEADPCSIAPTITPASGNDHTGTALGGLTYTAHAKTVTFRVKDGHNPNPGEFEVDDWETNASGTWADCTLNTYGITFNASSQAGIYIGWCFYVKLTRYGYAALGSPELIRMGANVIVKSRRQLTYWVNAVKLASGVTPVAGTDYGMVAGEAEASYLSPLTLSLCDLDGNAYSGVVVSATEPAQSGYWLDTSSDTPALQEWSVSQSMWVHITSTYVKISTFTNDATLDGIRAGDTVKLEAKCANGTDASAVELLNSTHYLYGADVGGSGYIIVAGILPSDSISVTLTESATAERTPPQMDFVVEAQNRLWGCRYDEANSINEIYCSALGDFKNWEVYQGISTDAWRASRGTAAPFTGAIAYGGYPLFFREESLEKVFPSSTGAHQIMVYSLDGVQKGSEDSLVIIGERLYYVSRSGVCVYTGTLPVLISDNFGEWRFGAASAGRDGSKYVACMTRSDNERLCMVYDTDTGLWHVEDETWGGIPMTWNDALYFIDDLQIYRRGAGNANGVEWWAESDELSLELPEHKWVYCLRLRFKLDLQAEARVYIAYDDGEWERKGAMHGNRLGSNELNIWPRRCDHFRIRLEGTGGCELQSISYRVERSEGGH